MRTICISTMLLVFSSFASQMGEQSGMPISMLGLEPHLSLMATDIFMLHIQGICMLWMLKQAKLFTSLVLLTVPISGWLARKWGASLPKAIAIYTPLLRGDIPKLWQNNE